VTGKCRCTIETGIKKEYDRFLPKRGTGSHDCCAEELPYSKNFLMWLN
jgi:hypothetical protein